MDCNSINVASGPLEPLPQNSGYTPLVAPGQFSANGLSIPANQSADVQALALATMNAYTVVKVSAGGVAPVDPTVPADQNLIFGVTLSGVTAGVAVAVRLLGALTNGLPGMQSWNWTVGAPVYVGAGGALTQTPNTSGWNQVIGRAIAAISVDLAIPPSAPVQRLPAVVTYASVSAGFTVDASATDSADVTLNATGGTLTLVNGFDGQEFRLAVTQGTGGSNTLAITGLLGGSYTPTITVGKIDLLKLRYVAARNAWALVSSTLNI